MSIPLNDDPEDPDLVAMRRLSQGDDRALNGIMERWKSRLISYLFRFTGDGTAASDLAQEAFVRLYQGRNRFRPSSSKRAFSTWLFGIAANLGRNHLRWQGRHPTLPLESAGDPASFDNPSRDAEAHELALAVQTAIALLPPDLRESLILSEYEGLSHTEVAMIAGCSVKAVERRLSRARELLKKSLASHLSV
jgi:RNA polymerase sigma-70 factor (ECF subfamily)